MCERERCIRLTGNGRRCAPAPGSSPGPAAAAAAGSPTRGRASAWPCTRRAPGPGRGEGGDEHGAAEQGEDPWSKPTTWPTTGRPAVAEAPQRPGLQRSSQSSAVGARPLREAAAARPAAIPRKPQQPHKPLQQLKQQSADFCPCTQADSSPGPASSSASASRRSRRAAGRRTRGTAAASMLSAMVLLPNLIFSPGVLSNAVNWTKRPKRAPV